jgi:hypothetical protein
MFLNVCGHYICKDCEEVVDEADKIACVLCKREYEELKPKLHSSMTVKLKEGSKLAFLNKKSSHTIKLLFGNLVEKITTPHG